MKRAGKPIFFIVALLILALAYTSIFGVYNYYGDTKNISIKGAGDIRFGIDIKGGVDATFVPSGGYNATDEQLRAAEEVMKLRLVNLNIVDYEIYTDYAKDRIILRFPWKEGEQNFNPEGAIREIGETARLTFREDMKIDDKGAPSGVTAEKIIIEGADVDAATPKVMQENGQQTFIVELKLKDSGKQKFAEATERLAGKGIISIWMDNTMISYPRVNDKIPDGIATISGSFTAESATTLANKINSGALPFALSVESFSTISPSLGQNALPVVVQAGILAYLLVCVFIIYTYRLPGVVAAIALLGQLAGSIAVVSGYFPAFKSFTLTLPGIAGIILSIGMGVDANIITSERIKEELQSGKTLDGSLSAGFDHGLAPIIDGNITVIIVAIILMGAFGPTDGFFAKMLKPIFFAFGPSTAGAIYSFGFTLLVGVIFNFLMGVTATRLMLWSISRFKKMRDPWLYGGGKTPVKTYNYDFVGNRKKFFVFSTVLLTAILLFSTIFGVPMDIQFKGGALVSYRYENELQQAPAEKTVADVLGKDTTVQIGSSLGKGDKTLTVSVPGGGTLTPEALDKVNDALVKAFPDNNIQQLEVSNVNPIMGKEFLFKSIVAIAAASLLILIYIAFRFKGVGGWPAGSMAVVALLHDALIIFGVYSFMRIPLNGNFVAALLTILGYSINDTVVIYDRIRENEGLLGRRMKFADIVNLSINQSLTRSINTSIATVIALSVLSIAAYLNGLESVFTFTFPLIIGMISGVYSTICLAGPLWVWWIQRKTPARGMPAKKTIPAAPAKAKN